MRAQEPTDFLGGCFGRLTVRDTQVFRAVQNAEGRLRVSTQRKIENRFSQRKPRAAVRKWKRRITLAQSNAILRFNNIRDAIITTSARACFSGERRVSEEVSAAKAPSRARDDGSGPSSAAGRRDRAERRGAGQVCRRAIARAVDRRQRESVAQTGQKRGATAR